MTIELDRVIFAGSIAVAAIVKRSVHSWHSFGALSVQASKQPVAVLIRQDNETTAFEIDGSWIEMTKFEKRFPGKCETFERFINANASA